MNRPYVVIPLTILVTIIATAGQTLLKRAVGGIPEGSTLFDAARLLLRSGSFYSGLVVSWGSTVTWLVVLSRADLSYASPIYGAMGILMMAASGVVVLGEPVVATRVIGTLVILIGLALVARR